MLILFAALEHMLVRPMDRCLLVEAGEHLRAAACLPAGSVLKLPRRVSATSWAVAAALHRKSGAAETVSSTSRSNQPENSSAGRAVRSRQG